MLNQKAPNSLKIPEYCLKRRNVKSRGGIDIPEIHTLTDEYWDSPRITPNFGDENDSHSLNQTMGRVPRIYLVTENELEDSIGVSKFPNHLMETIKESSGTLSGIRIPTDYIEDTNYDYDYDYDDSLTPLVSSAARYRLYDIDWDEKLRLNKGNGYNQSLEKYEIKLGDIDFRLLDSIGIKGPKEFETQQGKVTITKDGDFSFEFLGRKKLFTVKGGGCFVIVSDTINSPIKPSGPSFESAGTTCQDISEIEYHISELPQQHLKRYLYGTHLCETIKSFIPKVKLNIPHEGTYFLMSNHSTFADFRIEFNPIISDNVISAHLTDYQSTIIFTSKSGYRIELDKYVLDRMGVYEEVDQTFEEIKYKDYIIKKSHEISECGVKWSTIINIWRLILNRLVECKKLELKGLRAYSETLINADIGLTLCENSPNVEINAMDWGIRKSIYDGIFPIQIEKS